MKKWQHFVEQVATYGFCHHTSELLRLQNDAKMID